MTEEQKQPNLSFLAQREISGNVPGCNGERTYRHHQREEEPPRRSLQFRKRLRFRKHLFLFFPGKRDFRERNKSKFFIYYHILTPKTLWILVLAQILPLLVGKEADGD
jgi:hypothetical protein